MKKTATVECTEGDPETYTVSDWGFGDQRIWIQIEKPFRGHKFFAPGTWTTMTVVFTDDWTNLG